MRKIIFILMIFNCWRVYSQISPTLCDSKVITSSTTFSICDENPWLLVFHDEFNDSYFDTNVWESVIGVPRDPEFDDQKAWHLPSNIVEENGILKIISKRDSVFHKPVVKSWDPYIVEYDDFAYTTGEIWSLYKFGYGKFEARIKIPKGKGFWPAFWLWCNTPKYNENDIFEFMNNNTTTHYITTHFDFNGTGESLRCGTNYTSTDFSTDYHIFSVEWEKGQTRWYVDGNLKRIDFKYYNILSQPYTDCTIQQYGEYQINKVYPNSPMYMILNTAIESKNKAPDATTTFPSYLEIDWVRYYQRKPNTDISIDSSSIQLEDDLYNTIGGRNISIENCTIEQNQQVAIIAKNSITLKSGFHAKNGSFVTANIN